MSYRSSYKSSSYRMSSTSDDPSSSRTRGTGDGDSYSSSYTSRRNYNYDDASGADDVATSRSSRLRQSSRFSTDNDLDVDSGSSRYSSSKYKSLLTSGGDNDDYSFSSTRNYSRFGSRDESDLAAGTSSRVTRYSSMDADDDLAYSTTTTRRQTRLSYLDEEGTPDRRESGYSYTRRLTSDSYKDNLDDYKVTTPTDEESRSAYSLFSVTEVGDDSGSGRRRFQSSSRQSTLSRVDSRDAGQVYEAILDYEPPRSATDEIYLKEGQQVVVLSKDKPHKWRVRTRRSKKFVKVEEGFAPSAYLKATNESVDLDASDVKREMTPKDDAAISKDLKKKKDMIVRELIETEEDLIRDMQFVQRTYIRQSESSITPKEIKAVKDDLFGCFKDILAFHNDVLLKNFQKLSKEPATIGALFLKLQGDFDNHTKYFKNLPKALEILEENSDVGEFFTNYAVKVRDEKTLADHLKLPLQRISDYQLLLKELSKHLSRMNENVDDLEKALKVIAVLPEKTNTEEPSGGEEKSAAEEALQDEASSVRPAVSPLPSLLGESSDKLSRMLKNVLQAKDYFDVIESNGKAEERFIFLFKSRMFITEINKNISESQRTYDVKKIVKLPDVEVVPDESNPAILIIKAKDLSDKSYPIGLKCKSVEQAKTWIDYIARAPLSEDDKSEQSLIEQDDLFVNATAAKKPEKVDENNNLKAKGAAAAAASAAAVLREPSPTSNLSTAPAVNSVDNSIASLEGTSKSSADNAKADVLEDNTEATTAATDNLRTESFSSVDVAGKANKSSEKEAPTLLKIVQPLKAVTRHVGETAKFQCQVSASNLNVQWLKDNKVLSGTNFRTSKNNNTYILELDNLTLEDASLYTIVASNAKESISSSSALNVLSALGDSRPTSPGGSFLPHAPKFKVKLKDTELLEGTTVRFEIIVRGLPIPSISIMKDNKPLKEDDHVRVLFQSKEVFEIIIEHVKPDHAGLYKCIAINPEGQAETSGRISVSSDKNVFWGLDGEDNSTLTDDISSPRARSPAFKWFKDGQEFEASERFQVQFDDQEDNIVLIFQHVKPDDAGIYTCVASTSSGKISCSAELNVQGFVRELAHPPVAPEIKKELTNLCISEGESVAILEAQVSGYPKPKITWYKGAEALQASEHYKMLYEDEENYALLIKNVKDLDGGQYRLEACNELGTADTSAQLTVQKKPKFTQVPDSVEVMNNEKLVIEAKYEAVPTPKVIFCKDGIEVQDSKRVKAIIEKDKCQLIINKALSEDAGKYQIMICNELGKEERNVQVTVNSAPKFLKKLKAVEVWEGEVATFTAQCSSVPKATINFYKESRLLETSERIKMTEEDKEGNFQLQINKVTADDEGKYKCVLKNNYGEEEDSAELTVKKRQAVPEFKDKLGELEVKVGDDNVKLQVKVDGEPQPIYKWYHNGQEIKEGQRGVAVVNDGTGSTLIISKVAPEDHGAYMCKASNALGQVQSSSNLIVKGPPYVVKHLENVDSAADGEVTLTAIIKGNPTPKVVWFQGEKEVKLDSRRTYKYDEASAEYTLTIKKLILDDVGQYKIQASNEFGQCFSTSKVAIVSKPLFTKVLKNIVAKEMESNIEMVVQLDKMSSQPLIKWFKDDKEILESNTKIKQIHDKLDNSYKLVILKATEEMAGKWKCVASNDFGSTETAAKFDIISKPKFLKGLENLQVLEGDHVSMTVQIAGFPKPEVAFYKDGQDVSAEATIFVKKEADDIYVLEIENIRIIMSGDYKCVIKNEAGEASSMGVITVNGKPQIVKDLNDVSVLAGEDVALEVVITGKPSPDVKWFVNGKEAKGSERILLDTKEETYALKIPSAEVADSAVYHCIAANLLGDATSQKSNVKVTRDEKKPTFSKHIQDAVVVVDDSVRFEAQVSAFPEAEVTWSRDGAPLKASDGVIISRDGPTHVLILKGVQLADAGDISCKAQNCKGATADTAKLQVHEPTMPTISGLSDLSAIDGEPLKVEATVTGFPRPIVTWYKDGECVDFDLVNSDPKENKCSLNFKTFTIDMAGKYTCSAVNCAGEAVEHFSIFVSGKKPVFVKELEESIVMSVTKDNVKLKIDQNAIFETIVFGIPTPVVTWHKNEDLLRPNQRVTITNVEDEHKMEIKEVTKTDVAKYTCKAVNEYGEALSVCLLKFLNEPHPPIIKKPLEDVTVEEGTPLKLLCKVDGEPMPAVQWYKDDALLDQRDHLKVVSKADGSTILCIDDPVVADSGKFEVRAENAKGTATSTGKLVVEKPKRPPNFTKPLTEILKVEFNCPLILEATVFGLPQPQIEWVKDGKPVNRSTCPAARTSTGEKGECQLVIDNAKSTDAGQWSIKAINANGEALTTTLVQVMPEPFAPFVLENLPDKVQVAKEEPLELHAKISAYPLPTVTWLKNKKPIGEGEGAHIVTKPDGELSLLIDAAQLNQSGTYAVTIENSVGELVISTEVNVLSPSEASKTILSKSLPAKVELLDGEPLQLTANIDGVPPKEATWLKDGKPITVDKDGAVAIKEANGEYSLNIAKPDSGVYALVVRTQEGEKLQTQSEVAKGKGPFKVTEGLPQTVTLSPGEHLLLSMKLNSPEPITADNVTVFKDDKPISEQDRARAVTLEDGQVKLLREKCTPLDTGNYRIDIKTPDGTLSSSCEVKVTDKKQIDEDADKEKGDKPMFTKELAPVEVESGEPCRLECAIAGNPKDFTVSWYKDGEEIVPNEHFGVVKEPSGTLALLIDSFAVKDAGVYSVTVKNAAGEVTSATQAVLKHQVNKAKPAFADQLQATSIDEKSPLILKAKVVSGLPFESKWTLNDQPLKASDRIHFVNLPDGTVMLQVDGATMADAGNYKLLVTNPSGKSESQAAVTVQPSTAEGKPMTVVKGLTAVTLIAGEPGFIELKVDSDKEGDIKFLQDGKHILPTDRVHMQQLPGGIIRLTFDKVNLSDQGEYTVLFKNPDGQVQSSCPVTVKSKPIFIKPLSNLTVKEGCTAKFEVQVEGNPAPTVTWIKNGMDTSTESRKMTQLEGKNGTYFLVLDKCNFRDEAEYAVQASNELGEEVCTAKLSVIGSDKFEECAPTFLQGLQDLTVEKGDTFTLVAQIKSHPVPDIVWKKNGEVVSNSPRVVSNFDGSKVQLTVTNADASDFGTYELSIGNTLGQIFSKANVSSFKELAPKFVEKLTDTEAQVKQETKLTCRVEGYPKPNIFWLFNGKEIDSGVKYSIFKELDQQILIIFNPSEIDSGNYECRAQNALGSDRTEASVHFIEKDKKGEAAAFLSKLTNYDVLLGGTARMTACVIGSPMPELTWFKDGKEIKIDNEKFSVELKDNGMIRFEVRNVTQGDLGNYRCHASNIYGYDNSIAQLNLETVEGLDRSDKTHKSQKSQNRARFADDIDFQTSGLPVPLPDQPRITKMTDSSLTLIWMPSIPEQPRFPVSYVVEFGKALDGVWTVYQTDIKDTKCDVANLEPFQDYCFRIRVENKFGISDPSPSVTAFRSKLKVDHEPKEFKPSDFEVPHKEMEKIAASPKFLREEESFMYGMCGQPVTIEFWVYGYPEPNITWFCGQEKIEHSQKFNFMQDRNGKVCLFINKMDISDVGSYTCVAKNEHGEERRTIKLLNGEPPIFTKRLEETTVLARNHIRLECSFKGVPEPTVKWFKDYQPLHDTSRMSIVNSGDQSTLVISDCITRDMGLYSCTITNLAGSSTTAAYVHVKEADINYEKYPFSYNKAIKPQNKTIEQFYDLGDELGRGTQGITYHAVERSSGKSFAAKMMHGIGEMKQFMTAELDVMNQLGKHERLVQLRDAFATTPHSLSLITDMCGGGNLLDFILKKGQLTENEVAHYIRQLLEGLQYMHFKNIGHFGLTIGDLLMERINGPDLQICDFGLAQRVIPCSRHYVEYGHPEFVAPEIVAKNSVTFTSDTWSAGIVAYILLTGISPFLAENDRATLHNIQNKKLDLSHDTLKHISDEGQDFLRKMLDFDPINRFDVKAALNHPWLKLSTHPEGGNSLNVVDRLREYQGRYRKWYDNASCRRYYRRRPLHSCYTHPSRMIYPPDEQYSPLVSPDREIKKYGKTVSPFENVHPPNATDSGVFTSESHYQSGPDTYLLQLRDTAFPARIRKYLRIAATNSPSINYNLKQSHWGGSTMSSFTGHIPQVSIKERRKFTDVMDEEISDERNGFTNRSKPMRLVREVGTSSYAYGQLSSLRKEAQASHGGIGANLKAPFFREKLKDAAFKSGEDILFSCFAVGQPEPTYTWFRNESILIESSRVEVKRTSDGRCQLRIKPGREYDVAVYKCVARNSQGSVVCRARLNLGDVPDHLSPPSIKDGSAQNVLLAWRAPRNVGNSPVKYYKLEYKKSTDDNWNIVDGAILHEYFLVTDLQPETEYTFRLSAYNKFGWSAPSAPSEVARTLSLAENKVVALPASMQFVCSPAASSSDIDEPVIAELDYSRESNPVPLIKSDFKELYDFKSIIAKGKFSVVSRAYVKDGSRTTLACKCVLAQSEAESGVCQEYEIMKSLAHERIASLQYAGKDSNVFSLTMELLSGLNVLTYLSRKQFYTEDCVSKVVCQVLDALEYLHYRGIALLELQPDNVLVVDDRRLQVKLTDFANARYVSAEASKVTINANPEFISPEVIKNEEVTLPYTDIWSVGVLAYILMSGHSPFKGSDAKETAQNVVYVRYLFDRLDTEVTQEAIRFILTVFKLTQHKRPTIEECHESKWLLPNEFMIRKRQQAVFSSAKLNAYTEEYLSAKECAPSRLLDLMGLNE